MASWIDIFSLLMTIFFFVGTILGILYVPRRVSSRLAATKESLKNKGLFISREGVSVRMEKHLDRADYVEATQRGVMKALSASTWGPESNKHAVLPQPSSNKHQRPESFGVEHRRTHGSGDEVKC